MSAAGGWKHVEIRRLPGREPSSMVKVSRPSKKTTHCDHRGWSPHIAASRDKPAKPKYPPNGIFITSGEIGTNAMHPPGKRIRSDSMSQRQGTSETRGRTRRSAPTQRKCFNIRHHQRRTIHTTVVSYRPASAANASTKPISVSRHAGGRSGPPLRGGFSSIRGIN